MQAADIIGVEVPPYLLDFHWLRYVAYKPDFSLTFTPEFCVLRDKGTVASR